MQYLPKPKDTSLNTIPAHPDQWLDATSKRFDNNIIANMTDSSEKVPSFGCGDESKVVVFEYFFDENGKESYRPSCQVASKCSYRENIVTNPYKGRLQNVCVKCDSDKILPPYERTRYISDPTGKPFPKPNCICYDETLDFEIQGDNKKRKYYTGCEKIRPSLRDPVDDIYYHSPNIQNRVRNSANACLNIDPKNQHVLSSYYNEATGMYETICDNRNYCSEKRQGKLHKFVNEDNIEMCIPSGMQTPENFQYYFDHRDKYSFRR